MLFDEQHLGASLITCHSSLKTHKFTTVFLLDAEIPSVNRGVRNAQLVGDTGSLLRFILPQVLRTRPNWRPPSAAGCA